ncbi:hypothetical protein [Mycoplasma procyoni]|uniref:hypothetical protein n=1 Tax=Mycoplasma procyoni TaxID=568784 RepID=UPI00197C812B|nr:hypothetical protein [Mycoplasma procyoni]MBN3534736.1 hypothetical protein [Mycoplasma procyoni]
MKKKIIAISMFVSSVLPLVSCQTSKQSQDKNDQNVDLNDWNYSVKYKEYDKYANFMQYEKVKKAYEGAKDDLESTTVNTKNFFKLKVITKKQDIEFSNRFSYYKWLWEGEKVKFYDPEFLNFKKNDKNSYFVPIVNAEQMNIFNQLQKIDNYELDKKYKNLNKYYNLKTILPLSIEKNGKIKKYDKEVKYYLDTWIPKHEHEIEYDGMWDYNLSWNDDFFQKYIILFTYKRQDQPIKIGKEGIINLKELTYNHVYDIDESLPDSPLELIISFVPKENVEKVTN